MSDSNGNSAEETVVGDHRSRSSVRDVYDDIASHFSETRAYPWPEVGQFLDDIGDTDGNSTTCDTDGTTGKTEKRTTVGLDIGCGNGRHAALLADVVDEVLALDVSRELLGEARDRMAADGWEATLVQGDAASLPIEDGTVDVAVYVATLHHLPDRETRRASLEELGRVLGGTGRALVSAWSTAHERFDVDPERADGFDTTIDWTLPGGETVPRFYHIYAPAEFERDLLESGLVVDDVYVSSGNCYAEVRR